MAFEYTEKPASRAFLTTGIALTIKSLKPTLDSHGRQDITASIQH
ncbi:MAG: hypothetical protein ACYDEV_10670 [Acidiferrobacter sp.]